MAIYPVAIEGDIPVGNNKVVDVEGRSIGVYNVHGEYYAIHNSCPHQGAEICKGPVCGTTLESEVYEFIYGRDQEIANGVATQPFRGGAGESVLKQAAHEGFCVGQGDDAIADVADGGHAQLVTQCA